jgi:prevent-host-death family protein
LKADGIQVYSGPMKTMTVSEAETGFARLLRWVESGEEVEITQHQQPVAKVVPLPKPAAASLAGSVLEEGDFVSPTGARWEAAS